MAELIPGVAMPLEQFRVPVRRLLGHNAGLLTGPGTNSYLLGERQLALIDPGPDSATQLQSLEHALAGVELRYILVSHTHRDHSPAAIPLQHRCGGELVGLPAPPVDRHDRSFNPERAWRHGESIRWERWQLRLVHTPGHASNHLCFLLEEEKLLFTGDHILEGTTPVILPPDGNMADYLASLESLLRLDLAWLAPGHGRLIARPIEVIERLLEHRRRRESKVLAALRRDSPLDEDALLREVYDDVPSHLLPLARQTQLAHLLKLLQDGLVERTATGWQVLP